MYETRKVLMEGSKFGYESYKSQVVNLYDAEIGKLKQCFAEWGSVESNYDQDRDFLLNMYTRSSAQSLISKKISKSRLQDVLLSRNHFKFISETILKLREFELAVSPILFYYEDVKWNRLNVS